MPLRAVLPVLMLLLTACSPAGEEPTDGAQAAPQETAEVAAETGAAPQSPGDVEACADAVRVIAGISEALAAVINGQDVAADIEAQVAAIDEVVPRLPEEIRDDVEVVARTIGSIAEDFAALEWDPTTGATPPPEAADVVEGLTERLQAPEYVAASEEITAFFEAGCPA